VSHDGDEVGSNGRPTEYGSLIPVERFDFYSWRSSNNRVLKRGSALIFSQSDNHDLTKDFEVALKHLEYSPKLIDLSKTKETLQNG
jgi:hypothetical protein